MARDRKTNIKPLTEIEQRFCEEYLRNGCNAAAASLAIGRQKHAGFDFLKRTQVATHLSQVGYEQGQELGITFDSKAKVLWEIVNNDDAAHVDKIRAIDCLNKMQGHYKVIDTSGGKESVVFLLPSNKLEHYNVVDGEVV